MADGTKTAAECLADLYAVAGRGEARRREVLDDLVDEAGLGWRCTGDLPGDDNLPCGYLNVPELFDKPADAPCANCGAARSDDG